MPKFGSYGVDSPGVSVEDVERWLGALLQTYKKRHGLLPVSLVGYKLFTPIDDDTIEQTYVLELRPFNRFDPPDRQRADIDRAIERAVACF